MRSAALLSGSAVLAPYLHRAIHHTVMPGLDPGIRAELRLRAGDEIAYVIEDGRVVLSRARPDEAGEDPFSTFAEWDGAADTQAYAGL